ncbi:MAG: Fic family protein [Actinobacteria bacterium]|nr:Fic family protein [Actinomycetota bacterium]
MKLPMPPPSYVELLTSTPPERLAALIAVGPVDDKGRYLHWDELRYRQPPDGLTAEEWWLGTRTARRSQAKALPLIGTNGKLFVLSNVEEIQRLTHEIDQRASGEVLMPAVVTSPQASRKYLVSSLIEEAISSSQLEGASTTRREAKDMLRTGRKPVTHGEKMILNNFRAMELAAEESQSPLDVNVVMSLHRQVTAGTLEDERDAGRLQQPDEERIAVVWHDERVLHRPPAAETLPERLQAMCDFANGLTGDGFIHPVVRSIIVHFWLAYDHPFVDGNGRTARALFYRSMLSNGYWLTQYLAVSSVIKQAPSKYALSYLHAETDDNDITYFVIAQLRVIRKAIDRLYDYLERKAAESREVEQLLRGYRFLNHRQITLVSQLLDDPGVSATVKEHQTVHRVSNASARNDLKHLVQIGLLEEVKVGRAAVFVPAEGFRERLGTLGNR